MINQIVRELRASSSRCHREEHGQLSIISLVVILCVLILLCLVVNAAHVVKDKLEAQNSADAIAISSATHMARGMNAITAANHVIGELHALVILHHALGGDELDEGNQDDRTGEFLNECITVSYYDAEFWSKISGASYQPVSDTEDCLTEDVTVGAAIFDSRIHLKHVGTYAFCSHALCGKIVILGKILSFIPPLGKLVELVGEGGAFSCYVIEWKCFQEWRTLDLLEGAASAIVSVKQSVRDEGIPLVLDYTLLQSELPPERAEAAADKLGEYHHVTGTLFPGFRRNFTTPSLQLPVEQEPESDSGILDDIFGDLLGDDDELWRTQLARASVPWVHYWRLPLLQFGDDYLRLSHFKSYYVKWTQDFAIKETSKARKDHDIRLLVMKDTNLAKRPKGNEIWTRKNQEAIVDERFGVMGFALRPRPGLAAPAYFEEPCADGIAAYAQAMIYNANPQRRGSGTDEVQAEVGWDTLNWEGGNIPELAAGRDPRPTENTSVSEFSAKAPEPRIRVNWQAMLVPSTRVKESASQLPADLSKIIGRTTVDSGIARTH